MARVLDEAETLMKLRLLGLDEGLRSGGEQRRDGELARWDRLRQLGGREKGVGLN